MKVLLVGNYPKDRVESMHRFAQSLHAGLLRRGHDAKLLQPRPRVGGLLRSPEGIGKWLGYLDKFMFFPGELQAQAAWADVVHICDHGNAMYTKYLAHVPHVVTCHDLLAVRGALGEDTDCPASPAGKILQRWILDGLKRARKVVCDSTATLEDLRRLCGAQYNGRHSLVLLGLNHSYRRLEKEQTVRRLASVRNLNTSLPFVLQVGSNHARKNREGVLRSFALIRNDFPGQLVFAGEPLSPSQRALAGELGLSDRIVQIVSPDNDVLEALYNAALVLLFPSRFEGFGWPIIEAQACGCPVITSDRCSLPEVAGDSALIHPIEDEKGFAAGILRLQDVAERNGWVERGFENVKRFTTDRMLDDYVNVYSQLSSSSSDSL